MTGDAAALGELRAQVGVALGTAPAADVTGAATLRSVFPVSALATAAVGAVADQVAALTGQSTGRTVGRRTAPTVDRTIVDAWFAQALRPVGWTPPSPWDPIAGDYRTADGWIRLHTNAPRHRTAALGVLGVAADRALVGRAVARWDADELESAVLGAGGAAATMRAAAAWAAHPQGLAVAAEPLVGLQRTDAERTDGDPGSDPSRWQPQPQPQPGRPLAGLRVLDLTRVLAGPAATRVLAGLGATVLRIDPPEWDEPAIVPEMTLGKHTARLDSREPHRRVRLRRLLAGADVLVHGYRAGALAHLGLSADERRRVRPGLIDVALTAYGWTGPWADRRGFDSLVQMSTGIAQAGMRAAAADRPVPLPVQALDHATGWLLAAAALRALRDRADDGRGTIARLSLARIAAVLQDATPAAPPAHRASADRKCTERAFTERASADAPTLPADRIGTPWGAADLLRPPFTVPGVEFAFRAGPAPLGSDPPEWPTD